MQTTHQRNAALVLFWAILSLGCAQDSTTSKAEQVDNILVDGLSSNLLVGDNITIVAHAFDVNDAPLPPKPFVWKTSDSSVVSIEVTKAADGTPTPGVVVLHPLVPGGPVQLSVSAGGVTRYFVLIVIVARPIALSRNQLNFSATEGADNPAIQTINVSSTGDGTLDGLTVGPVSYQSGIGWLGTATLDRRSTPAVLSIAPQIAGLAPGTYTATLGVFGTGLGGSPTPLPVTISLKIYPKPALVLSTTELLFAAPPQVVDSQTIAVTKLGEKEIDVTLGAVTLLTGSVGWLRTPVLDRTTTPATLKVVTQPTLGNPGVYRATFTVVPSPTSGAQPQVITVTYVYQETPVIGFSPSPVSITAASPNPIAQNVQVTNTGFGTLSNLALGPVTYITGNGWITSATLNGTSAPATISLTVSSATLPAGQYQATILVTGAGVNSTTAKQTLTVNLVVPP